MNVREFDVVVLGQGLAGTTLAWWLRWQGQRVLVIDRETAVTSSRVAAGLITPITGLRLVKSWRWDLFWPVAQAFYRRVEAETGSTFFQTTAMVRLFANPREQQYFAQRIQSEFTGIVDPSGPLIDGNVFDAPLGAFEMHDAGRLDVPQYLTASLQAFQRDEGYCCETLELERDLELDDAGVRIPRLNIRSSRLIFCQGIEGTDNPWFRSVAFNPAKGEILTLRIPGLSERRVIHRGIWLMPMGNEIFRAGATYDWDISNCQPTLEGRNDICDRLRQFLKLPFEVIGHDVGVRPILHHQNPRVGLHPRHRQLGLMNGLGSKGALQAPWLARHFVGYLANENPLDPEVDVSKEMSDP